MKRLILPLAACTAVALALAAFARPVQTVSSMQVRLHGAGCENIWLNEPVVVYQVEGSTLIETVHSTLVVFGSGSVTYVSSSSAPTEGAGGSQTSFHVDPRAVHQLLDDLAAAGAFSACDSVAAGSDIPLTTVTVIRGGTDAHAHTFSFFDNFGDPVYADVQDILGDFIATL